MKATQVLRIVGPLALLLLVGPLFSAEKEEGWIVLFNGKDLAGWKLKSDKYTVTKFVEADGKEIKGARKAKLDQKDTVVDAKNKPIEGAKIATIEKKNVAVDAEGKPIPARRSSRPAAGMPSSEPTARRSRASRQSPRPCQTRPEAGRSRMGS